MWSDCLFASVSVGCCKSFMQCCDMFGKSSIQSGWSVCDHPPSSMLCFFPSCFPMLLKDSIMIIPARAPMPLAYCRIFPPNNESYVHEYILYDRSDATNGQSLLCMESECGRCAIDDETYLNILDLEETTVD